MHAIKVDKYSIIDFRKMPTNRDFYELFEKESKVD